MHLVFSLFEGMQHPNIGRAAQLKKSTVRFFYIFLSFFSKIYGPKFFLQDYTSSVVVDSGRDLPPCPTALRAHAVL
jgi:hypothetical protein